VKHVTPNQLAAPADPTETYRHDLFNAISSLPNVIVDRLPSNAGVSRVSQRQGNPNIAFIESYYMSDRLATLEEDESDTRQHLEAVIKAGDELFGVVRVGVKYSHEDEEGYSWSDIDVLTRLGEAKGEPSTVISPVWPNKVVRVGRNHQKSFGSTTSREHFSIAKAGHDVKIEDLHSSNGTVLLRPIGIRERDSLEAVKPKLGLAGLKKVISGKKPVLANPLDNKEVWSLKPETIKQVVHDYGLVVYSNLYGRQ
jgi:hypothetical protein